MSFRHAPLLALGLLTACSDTCENDVIRTIASPGHDRTAVLFQRDCGATTPFSTQLSILSPGERPTGSANVFIADADHGRAVTGDGGGPWMEARWIDEGRLLIRYARGSRVFLQERVVGGVAVTFQEGPR